MALASGCATTSASPDMAALQASSCPPPPVVGEEDDPSSSGIVPRILAITKPHMGTRHVYGGTKPGGFDCSGFTAFVYREFGIKLPRGSYNQLTLGKRVAKKDLQPGDLVFFSVTRRAVVTHVGIYLGDDKMVHTSQKRGVTISNIFADRYWRKYYYGARRLSKIEKLKLKLAAAD